MYQLSPNTIIRGKKYSYTINKVLGQGAFGITYLATVRLSGDLGDLQANFPVCIKEFFMKELNGRNGNTVTTANNGRLVSEYRNKFKREAQNLSRLKHDNIVSVLELFETNNTVYYSMEYLPLGSLDDYINQHSRLNEKEAIKKALQICKPLSFMHKNKMLHLDLKPKNIMVDNNGSIKLIDFGLSKQYNNSGEPESSTSVGSGTPGYAPIEQANYHEGKDFPVTMDVYALGATMFKLLTGVRPPEASYVLNNGLPLQQLKDAGVSDATIAIVKKAMDPFVKYRYQTIAEFMRSFGTNEKETTIIDTEMSVEEKSLPKTEIKRRSFEVMRIDFVYHYGGTEHKRIFRNNTEAHAINAILRKGKNINKHFYYPSGEKIQIILYDEKGIYETWNVDAAYIKMFCAEIPEIDFWMQKIQKDVIRKDEEEKQEKIRERQNKLKKNAMSVDNAQTTINKKNSFKRFLFDSSLKESVRFFAVFLTCTFCIIEVMYWFEAMPYYTYDQIISWKHSFFEDHRAMEHYQDGILLGVYFLSCYASCSILESSFSVFLKTIFWTIYFPIVVGVAWLVPGIGEWVVDLFINTTRGLLFYSIQFLVALSYSLYALYNERNTNLKNE